jgi:hypothetical protein
VLVAKAILEQMKQIKDIQEPELDDKVKQNIELYKEILSKPNS